MRQKAAFKSPQIYRNLNLLQLTFIIKCDTVAPPGGCTDLYSYNLEAAVRKSENDQPFTYVRAPLQTFLFKVELEL